MPRRLLLRQVWLSLHDPLRTFSIAMKTAHLLQLLGALTLLAGCGDEAPLASSVDSLDETVMECVDSVWADLGKNRAGGRESVGLPGRRTGNLR